MDNLHFRRCEDFKITLVEAAALTEENIGVRSEFSLVWLFITYMIGFPHE